MSVVSCVLWTLLAVAPMVDAGLRCECSINGVTYSLVGINCARPNTTDIEDKAVQCEQARYGAVEAGYMVNPAEKAGGYKSLYRLYRTVRNWEAASESCWKDGGHLAVPSTHEEVTFLGEQVRLQGDGRTNLVMLGVRLSEDGERVTSVTGENAQSVVFQRWPAGTPRSVPGQLCLQMLVKDNNYEAFITLDCEQPLAYFCERALNPPVNGKYKFVAGLGFYMPLGQFLSYNRAERQCQTTGGHLVVPDTQQEADALMKAFDLYPQIEQIYVGFNDRRQAGVFESVHGGRLEWMDFQNWAPGALESRSADVHCIVLTASGNYKLVHCDTPLPSICEWKLR